MEATFLAQNFVPIMFGGLLVLLLTGFPVAFALAACGLGFGFIGMEAGLFPPSLFQALPLRIFGIMQNDTLLAIPFFTFMGIILQKSGMAEDLLETVGQVFGPVRGGVAIAVILVGALLAATTGVAFLIIVFCEITPKVIGSREAIARPRPRGSSPRSGPKLSFRRRTASGATISPIGTLTQKIHCQEMPSVIAPPTTGPIATPSPETPDQAPIASPRLPSGTASESRVRESGVTSAAPSP
jgi:hypothetical protein